MTRQAQNPNFSDFYKIKAAGKNITSLRAQVPRGLAAKAAARSRPCLAMLGGDKRGIKACEIYAGHGR
jgi:hypothetical protein